jgi:HK97 gp10 family phage protein
MIGLKEANRALKMLPDFAKSGCQQVMDASAFTVARAAQSRAPVLTGLLRRSIEWKSQPRSVTAVVGTPVGTAFYWKFLEYGTEHIQARPFMRPAAESIQTDHQSRLERALNDAANKVERAAGSRLF